MEFVKLKNAITEILEISRWAQQQNRRDRGKN